MAKLKKRSVAPIYAIAAVWVIYTLVHPLYRVSDYVSVILISAVAFVVAKGIWPTIEYELPDAAPGEAEPREAPQEEAPEEPQPEPREIPEEDPQEEPGPQEDLREEPEEEPNGDPEAEPQEGAGDEDAPAPAQEVTQ